MGSVTITLTDVVVGAMDGSINMTMRCDPPIALSDEHEVIVDRLSEAQAMALGAVRYLRETYGALSTSAEIEPMEDA